MVVKVITESEARQLRENATPGPWKIDQRMSNVVRPGAGFEWVGVAGHRTDVPVFTGQTSSRDRAEWEADAALIARAPDAMETIEALWSVLKRREAGFEECFSILNTDDPYWWGRTEANGHRIEAPMTPAEIAVIETLNNPEGGDQ